MITLSRFRPPLVAPSNLSAGETPEVPLSRKWRQWQDYAKLTPDRRDERRKWVLERKVQNVNVIVAGRGFS